MSQEAADLIGLVCFRSVSGSEVPEIDHLKAIYSHFPWKFHVALSCDNSSLDNRYVDREWYLSLEIM